MHLSAVKLVSLRCRAASPRRLAFFALSAALLLAHPLPAAEAEHPGAAIYRKLCAECHGQKGEGVQEKYDEPLHGNRSVENLAKRIARTMPEDNIGACVGEDAKQVAAYIYDAFYSPQAHARLRPPEFDLARLTIEQYRNSIADIVGRFRPGFDKPRGAERGLKARYQGLVPGVAAAKLVTEQKKEADKYRFERTDPRVEFTFTEASPDPEKMANEDFSIHWEGSVFAEETGVYEFILKTENGVRMWVNDTKVLLIDAWVGSGTMREEKKSLYLVGGRSYPLVLDYFRVKEKAASIVLQWKTPHGVVETIPQEALAPDRLRQTMVVKTAFPPDDRSVGYERGTGVSKDWDQATTEAALDVSEHVETNLDELSGSKANAPDRADKLKAFGRKFTEAAFRRPLNDEEVERYVTRHFTAAKTPELGLKRTVLFALKSPRFLYPEVPSEKLDDYDIAARLALHLWDSIPDTKLLQDAAAGKLHTHDQIAAAAARMVADQRTKAKLRGFFHYWLELERAEAITKDAKKFPDFNAQTLSDLRTSLALFLDQVVWGEKSDYRELLQANYLLLNDRLAKLYGKSVEGAGFQRVEFDPKQRAGVVTHPYLLAAFASGTQTSPIHRGVFLTRTIVGMTLKPPPQAVAFEDAKFEAHLTMREKITELTKNQSCMSCHGTINPLGFSLENYDAIGRWRTQDNNKPINAVSEFNTDEGDMIRLTGARDLVKFAAESPGGHRAFIHQLFHHTVKQSVDLCGPDALEHFRQGFVKSEFNVRKLLTEIATVAAERGLAEPEHKVALAK